MTSAERLEIVTFAERPDLDINPDSFAESWPVFMFHDPLAFLYYEYLDDWAEHVLLGLIDGKVVVRGLTVAFSMESDGREGLPDGGWDTVVRWGHFDRLAGVPPTHVSALEVVIDPAFKGEGLSTPMVQAMTRNVDRLGFKELVAPVRPSGKHLFPCVPMEEYVARTRDDGLPEDPWMRVHARLGAETVSVCPTSMTITGTIAQWTDWTGVSFDHSGDIEVPGALVPIHVDMSQNHAVYVEPNVWMRHSW